MNHASFRLVTFRSTAPTTRGSRAVSNQVILRRFPTSMSHDVFAKTLALEDVLVSTVFGAIAYAPPAMPSSWRRRFTSLPPLSPDVGFEFWPSNHTHLGRLREPDVFIVDRRRREALIVEAKRGRMPKVEAPDPADCRASPGNQGFHTRRSAAPAACFRRTDRARGVCSGSHVETSALLLPHAARELGAALRFLAAVALTPRMRRRPSPNG